MKGWSHLGAVETIYEEGDDGDDEEEEEEEEEESLNSDVVSPNVCSPFAASSLHSRVDAWSVANGYEPDVLVRVQGTGFRLHKDPLTSRSSYLRRRLTTRSDVTLSPPLKITADTFLLVADFCYGARIVVTPFNVAALRTAAELLEMTEGNGDGGNDLRLVTETAFRRFEAVNMKYVKILFHSCLDLLPEAETAAFLASRCVDAFSEIVRVESLGGCGSDGSVTQFLDGIATVGMEEFEVTVESMGSRLSSHDVLYRMVDIYLKEHGGKMTEEHKAMICQSVDCTKLTPDLLVHAVQNPKMPLRFIIRAMLVEQLRTRHSFLQAATAATAPYSSSDHRIRPSGPPNKPIPAAKAVSAPTTLGAILNRDAALRQSAQLRAAMAATRSRIQSLEEELGTMKLQLMSEMTAVETGSADNIPAGSRSVLNSGRSLSFGHYGRPGKSSKIERGEKGSVSSLSLRFTGKVGEGGDTAVVEDQVASGGSPRCRRSIRERLISGLKSAFGASNSNLEAKGGGGRFSGGSRDVHALHGKACSPAQVGF